MFIGNDCLVHDALNSRNSVSASWIARDYFYKVISAVVRICKFLNDGRRQIEGFQSKGEIFGLEAGPIYLMTAEAASDCTVIAYRRNQAGIFSVPNPDLSRELLAFAMGGLSRTQAHSLVLGRRSTSEKIAHFLLEYAKNSNSGKRQS